MALDSSLIDEQQMPRAANWVARLRARTVEPLWRAMAQVAKLGDLATRCEPLEGSELAPLRDAFDAMVERLERRENARERHRRRITALLGERERELVQRRERMDQLLAAMGQAVIVVDNAGMPRSERSAAFDLWFGAPEPGQSLARLPAPANTEKTTKYE